MGKYNEIQEETTQSWGSNSFTTTVKEDTVEFDSAKDKFTFKDEVEVPSLKVNGESVSSQVQSDWNQNDNTKADYIKNKPSIPTPEPQVQADWNQNDNTAADYIKNRICYDSSAEKTILPETQVQRTAENYGYAYFDFPGTTSFKNGFWYITNIDSDPSRICYCSTSGSNASFSTGTVTIEYVQNSPWSGHNGRYNDNYSEVPSYHTLQIMETVVSFIGSSPSGTYTTNGNSITAGKNYFIGIYNSSGNYTFIKSYSAVAENNAESKPTLTFGENDTTITYATGNVTVNNAEAGVFYVVVELESLVNGIDDKYIPQLGGVQFKIEGSPAALKASLDGGSTWQTVTLS